jgi:hypothetical protein
MTTCSVSAFRQMYLEMSKYLLLYFTLCIWFAIDRIIDMEMRSLGEARQVLVRSIILSFFITVFFMRNRILAGLALLFRRRKK